MPHKGFEPMKISFFVLLIMLAKLVSANAQVYPYPPSFYPQRPAKITIHIATGILTAYGRGNKSGGFSIQEKSAGKINWFYIGSPMKINGSIVWCGHPGTQTHAAVACTDWPANVRLGTTQVKVSFWKTTRNGERIDVSDQIDSIVAPTPPPTACPTNVPGSTPNPHPTQSICTGGSS